MLGEVNILDVGMLGEVNWIVKLYELIVKVMDGTADLCIADMSITTSRRLYFFNFQDLFSYITLIFKDAIEITAILSLSAAFTFSMPWMNLGIAILYINPRSGGLKSSILIFTIRFPAAPSLLAFLDPFTADLYVYILLLFILVTLVIYILARL